MTPTSINRRRALLAACAYGMAQPFPLMAQPSAAGQDPSRPIRLIVPFPPGGTTDFMARLLAEKMFLTAGRRLIVENKDGAGGMIGSEYVARAPADGYTLLLPSSAQLSLAPGLYPKVPYDPVRDFSPITLIGATPNVLLAHPSLPVKTLPDVIALARAKPHMLSCASPGQGSTAGLAMELLKQQTRIELVQVPYRGAGPAIVDALSGQVPLIAVAITSIVAHVKSGKLRPIAITSRNRSPTLPDVPAFAETLPGFEASGWYGIAAPAGTPQNIVHTLNQQLHTVLARQDVQAAYAAQGVDVLQDTPEAFADFIKSELVKWTAVIRQSGAQAG